MKDRREFLKALSASTAAAWMARAPRLMADEVKHPAATADSCILLWSVMLLPEFQLIR